MDKKRNHPKIGLQLRYAFVRFTGCALSIGGKIAPQRFASILMRLIFSPDRMRLSEEARKILGNASTEHSVVDGNKITRYIWGAGDKCVLLVHGWSGHAGQMTLFAESLAAAGFKVIAIDLPGHGKSEGKRSSVIHFERVIADAGKCHGPFHAIVAHSLGAAAATYAISRGLGCERAVFFSPVACYESVWRRMQELLHVSPGLLNLTIRRAEDWLRISFDDIEPARLAPGLSTRLLVIHDNHDRETPIADSRTLVEVWPDARLLDTHKLGHARILSDNGMVRQATDFIAA